MAYNTNNPVGSTDPRDLYDNAGNLDKFVNGDAPFYADRLGQQRKSWSGMEADFASAQEGREATFYAFLSASGYEPNVLVYGNIIVERPTQLINKNGVIYRTKPSISFPYQLTGVWATDSQALLAVVDDRMAVVHPSTDFTASLLDDPVGAADFYSQLAADPRSVGLMRGTGAWTLQDRLAMVKAKMAAGQQALIVCFGDSTTDGVGTTGYVGNAIGNGGNLSPNAWPTKLQGLLREMYSNNSIRVFNAGFSGRKIVDGWAYSNYAAAVIDNASCGRPDICLVAFGLNDITGAGSQISVFAQETRMLCVRMLLSGTVPVLVSCDPHYRVDSDKDNKESSRQIDLVKKSIADELRIPFYDVSSEIKKWLSVNSDNVRWGSIQSDALHFNDVGHAFKASWFAKELFSDVFIYGGGDVIIPAQDSRSNPVLPSNDFFRLTNNRQGGNYNTSIVQSQDVAQLTAWVWNEARDTKLLYLGVADERVVASTTVFPRILYTNKIDGSQISKRPAMATPSVRRRLSSDIPAEITFLNYGLSKVQYFPGGGPIYYGCFSLLQAPRSKRIQAIAKNGLMSLSSTDLSFLPSKNEDGSNYFGLCDGDEVVFMIDATVGLGAGVVLAACPAFDNVKQLDPGVRNVLMVYSSASHSNFVVSVGQINADGTVNESASLIVYVTSIPRSSERFMISFKVINGSRQIGSADGYLAELTYGSLSANDPQVIFGGVVGGVFKQIPGSTAEVRSVVVKR